MKLPEQFVTDFLYAVGREAGGRDERFEEEVREQLTHGEREYGDQPARSLLHFQRNQREEAADITAWAAPFLARLNEEDVAGRIDRDLAHQIRVEVIQDCAVAQQLWRRMDERFNELAGHSR